MLGEGHDVVEGVRYPYNASPDQCKEDCSGNESCKFWTLASNICYLKSEMALEKRSQLNHTFSGTNQCPGTWHIS
jgi:hypothetical protein